MNTEIKTITINGVEYIEKSQVQEKAQDFEGMRYCVIRTYSAGVHIGYVKLIEGKEVELINSRRLWYWKGACSLSQVANDGVGEESKLAQVLPEIILTEAIEIIPCSKKAQECIEEFEVWEK